MAAGAGRTDAARREAIYQDGFVQGQFAEALAAKFEFLERAFRFSWHKIRQNQTLSHKTRARVRHGVW